MKERKLGFLPEFVSMKDELEVQFLLTDDNGIPDEKGQRSVLNAIRPYLVNRDEGKKFDHKDGSDARQFLVRLIKYNMFSNKNIEELYKNELTKAYFYLVESEVKKRILANPGSFCFKTDYDRENAPKDIANDTIARGLNKIDKYDESSAMFSTFLIQAPLLDAISDYKKESKGDSSKSTSDRNAKVKAAIDELAKQAMPITISNVKRILKKKFNTELSEAVIAKAIHEVTIKSNMVPFDPSINEYEDPRESTNPETHLIKKEEAKALNDAIDSALSEEEWEILGYVYGLSRSNGELTNVLDDYTLKKWESFHRPTLTRQKVNGKGNFKSGESLGGDRSNEDILHSLKEKSVEYKKTHTELSDAECGKEVRRMYYNAKRKLLEALLNNPLLQDRKRKKKVTDGSYKSLYKVNGPDYLELDSIVSITDNFIEDIDNGVLGEGEDN